MDRGAKQASMGSQRSDRAERLDFHFHVYHQVFNQILSKISSLENSSCGKSIQLSSVAQLCPTLCDAMDCSTPGFPVHHQLPEPLMSIASVMPSNHLILCRPILLLPSIFPRIRVFSNDSDGGQSIGVSASTPVFPMNI